MAATGTETLGQRIRRLRVKQGIRQVDLAAKARVSWRHLIRIEQDAGGATKVATLARLAEALGVTPAELAGGEDEDDEESETVLHADLLTALRPLARLLERAGQL